MCHSTQSLPDAGHQAHGEARALDDTRTNVFRERRPPRGIGDIAKALLAPFRVNTNNPALLQAQMKAFSKQVPLLYFILSVNALTLALTFYGKAPSTLIVMFPAFLTGVCVLRVVIWLRSSSRPMSDKETIRRLYGVVVVGGILGVIYLTWTLALYGYGDANAKGVASLFVTITTTSVIFCLMHLRAAAMALMVTIAVPFAVFLMLIQESIFFAVGVNLLLVSGAMVYIVFVVSTDFEKMINGQTETARLSDENHHLANVDNLTGLPNRRYFFQQLDRLLQCAQCEEKPFVVGVIDLDGFKAVNDISSLSYVHRLPLDTIKIDRSFVTDIETRDTSRDIVRTIVALCRNLGIDCVIEGMETEMQTNILRDLGCQTMQGYFFSKPLAQSDVLEFLAQRELVTSD